MTFDYYFTKTITKLNAFIAYIKANITWVTDYDGVALSGDQLIISAKRELTTEEQAALATLVTDYVDPDVWLVLDHTEAYPMYSTKSTFEYGVVVDGKKVLQTIIFSNQNNDQTVLNSLKTIVQYYCPDVAAFQGASGISGIATFQIYDLDRDVEIALVEMPLAEIGTKWENMGATGITGPDTVFRTVLISGLRNLVADYDCKWQFRGVTNSDLFSFKLDSLQYLFYTVE